MNRTVGTISSENIRAERQRLKLTADDLAERVADLSMTATVLRNVEAGRRRNPATIDEWLALAHALNVPPETLLLPDENTEADVVPGVSVGRRDLLRWIRGEAPLPGVDERHYKQIAALTLPTGNNRANAAQEELLRRVGSMLDIVDESIDDVTRKTRRQVYDLLTELQDMLAGDTDRAQISEKIETYKDRLAELV